MSLAQIRPYFRNIINPLSYVEHQDGFAFDNIPSNLLDRSYHVQFGFILGSPLNQTDQRIESEVVVRLFFKGYRNVSESIDNTVDDAQAVIAECLKIGNRSDRTKGVVNVQLNTIDVLPFADSNDNNIIYEINFSAVTIFCTDD